VIDEPTPRSQELGFAEPAIDALVAKNCLLQEKLKMKLL
jgi:hypothetical protein